MVTYILQIIDEGVFIADLVTDDIELIKEAVHKSEWKGEDNE